MGMMIFEVIMIIARLIIFGLLSYIVWDMFQSVRKERKAEKKEKVAVTINILALDKLLNDDALTDKKKVELLKELSNIADGD